MEERKLKKVYIIIPVIVLIIGSGLIVFFTYYAPEKIEMLDLNNFSLKEIEEYAQNNSLVLDIEYLDNEDIPKDKLISQSIKMDTIISRGDHLKVLISKGPFDKSIYTNMKVNELGRIPVMMYHGIQNITKTNYTGGNIDKDGYQRTADSFRKDLEFYYQNNYRMIRLNDYVQGIIDVPMGNSPLVLTFDDGNANNIKVTGLTETGEIIIDPNSAVGILEEFKHKYPDFQVTATFFVTNGLFNQPEYNDKILNWLVKNGYDIGNHTAGHTTLGNISEEEVVSQIGRVYKKLEVIIPNKYVNIISLPFGSPYSSDHKNFTTIMHGTYEGIEYTNIAALRVGWDADYSPFSKSFNPKYIKRIRAYDSNGKNFDIEMNFKLLEGNRYISDGDKDKIVIFDKDKDKLIETTLKVITY